MSVKEDVERLMNMEEGWVKANVENLRKLSHKELLALAEEMALALSLLRNCDIAGYTYCGKNPKPIDQYDEYDTTIAPIWKLVDSLIVILNKIGETK